MARSFLGGEFAGGESAWWRGDWIPCNEPVKLFCFDLRREIQKFLK